MKDYVITTTIKPMFVSKPHIHQLKEVGVHSDLWSFWVNVTVTSITRTPLHWSGSSARRSTCCTSLATRAWSLDPKWRKRTDSWKLSSDLYTWAKAQSHTFTHRQDRLRDKDTKRQTHKNKNENKLQSHFSQLYPYSKTPTSCLRLLLFHHRPPFYWKCQTEKLKEPFNEQPLTFACIQLLILVILESVNTLCTCKLDTYHIFYLDRHCTLTQNFTAVWILTYTHSFGCSKEEWF